MVLIFKGVLILIIIKVLSDFFNLTTVGLFRNGKEVDTENLEALTLMRDIVIPARNNYLVFEISVSALWTLRPQQTASPVVFRMMVMSAD